MENMVSRTSPAEGFHTAYRGKRAFVTGHTGFKGGWLCEWLLSLGAEVAGYGLAPNTSPALFDELRLESRLRHQIGDIRDGAKLKAALLDFRPDYVFHLAAQPLVRLSYAAPVETFEINIMGTVHLLEAVRALAEPCSVVVVTTDKCYHNKETGQPFTEEDPLGGHDPYSASKAGTEIVATAYNHSFFNSNGSRVALASARAGNVIGGGDWAVDRIVPDAVRALATNRPIRVRNPSHIRPWQHVLDPLSGYLLLGSLLANSPDLRTAFNFGPDDSSSRTVRALIEEVLRHWPGTWHSDPEEHSVSERTVLRLAIEKARSCLGWQPTWGFVEAVKQTIGWYKSKSDPRERTLDQIQQFQNQMVFA